MLYTYRLNPRSPTFRRLNPSYHVVYAFSDCWWWNPSFFWDPLHHERIIQCIYIYVHITYICMSRIIFYPFDLHLGSIHHQPVNRRDGRCGKCLAQHPCAACARMLSLTRCYQSTGGLTAKSRGLTGVSNNSTEISPANPLRSRTGFCYPRNVPATSYIPTSEIILVDGLNHQPDVFQPDFLGVLGKYGKSSKPGSDCCVCSKCSGSWIWCGPPWTCMEQNSSDLNWIVWYGLMNGVILILMFDIPINLINIRLDNISNISDKLNGSVDSLILSHTHICLHGIWYIMRCNELVHKQEWNYWVGLL